MNPTPDFDELVGGEPLGGERERLRRAHELLVAAGPPQELPPALGRGPDSERSQTIRRRQVKRRVFLLVAAVVAVAAVFSSGYAVGNRHSTDLAGLLALEGTAAAPHARATLEILPATAGNWPMKLTVRNLPALPANAYYDVYLVRKGDRYLSCGRFVTTGGSAPFTVPLNAPYRLGPGDKWIVTRESPGSSDHGTTVLRPV